MYGNAIHISHTSGNADPNLASLLVKHQLLLLLLLSSNCLHSYQVTLNATWNLNVRLKIARNSVTAIKHRSDNDSRGSLHWYCTQTAMNSIIRSVSARKSKTIDLGKRELFSHSKALPSFVNQFSGSAHQRGTEKTRKMVSLNSSVQNKS